MTLVLSNFIKVFSLLLVYLAIKFGQLNELITGGLNALRECLPGDSELTSQVMNT